MSTDTARPVTCRALAHGLLADFSKGAQPSLIHGWTHQPLRLRGEDDPRLSRATHFGFALSGGRLRCESGYFPLAADMYFAAVGDVSLEGGSGLIASRLEHRGFFQLGGPFEARGRLRYIDGCSDSLLIAPVEFGAACLNLLHVPPGTNQTRHTHPSLRAGLIVRGEGVCRTPQQETPLTSGTVFLLPAAAPHSFHTTSGELTIVAFHPDSDSGPTDDDHPMLNRTIIDR